MIARTSLPVRFLRTWSASITDAVHHVGVAGDYPPELYASLLEHAVGSGGELAIVGPADDPTAVVGLLTAGTRRWANATNWLLPGVVCAGPPERALDAMAALRRDVAVAWWHMGTEPAHPAIRSDVGAPVRAVRLAEREAFWRTSGQWRAVKHARNRCEGLDVVVDGPGDAEWVVRCWAAKWSGTPGGDPEGFRVAERLEVASALAPRGRHMTVTLRAGDQRIAGATMVRVGDAMVAGVLYRDESVGGLPSGVRVIDASMTEAARRGALVFDLGGGHAYKSKWAPQVGLRHDLEIAPALSHWARTRVRAARSAPGAAGRCAVRPDELTRRGRDAVTSIGRVVLRGATGLLVRAAGAPRVAAWAVGLSTEPDAPSLARQEISAVAVAQPADVVGSYLAGFVLMGRGGDEDPEVFLRFVGPRAVIDEASARVPARARAYARKGDVSVVQGAPLLPVIERCRARERTWIVEPLVERWQELDRLGHVHTVAVVRDGEVVAGIWGIAVGRVFGMMSMFHSDSGAGALALSEVVADVGPGARWDLLDCGSLNGYVGRYGAYEVTHEEFTARVLAVALPPRPHQPAGVVGAM